MKRSKWLSRTTTRASWRSPDVALGILQPDKESTLTYSYQPTEPTLFALVKIRDAAADSEDLGVPGQIVVTKTQGQADASLGDDPDPERMVQSRTDWVFADGTLRIQDTETTLDGQIDPAFKDLEFNDRFYEYPYLEPPAGPFPKPWQIVLGPTVEDSKAAFASLSDSVPEGSAFVDMYLGYYSDGIGLTASNRAAFLDLLGTLDVTYYGPSTDALGRTGEAFSVSSSKSEGTAMEYRMLFDPSNGALLAWDEVWHDSTGRTPEQDNDRAAYSVTVVSIETVTSVPPCDQVPGCRIRHQG